ncbi:uncharacterized protein LOC119275679 isoform X2 [Triticum dicoccoides]|nr:uncharacterized protein LOC119275679 isoform X2 [Triticum dicoccoides]
MQIFPAELRRGEEDSGHDAPARGALLHHSTTHLLFAASRPVNKPVTTLPQADTMLLGAQPAVGAEGVSKSNGGGGSGARHGVLQSASLTSCRHTVTCRSRSTRIINLGSSVYSRDWIDSHSIIFLVVVLGLLLNECLTDFEGEVLISTLFHWWGMFCTDSSRMSTACWVKVTEHNSSHYHYGCMM